MVEKATRFIAFDGRDFIHEEAALRHEAIERMISCIPELALVRGKLESNLNQISTAMIPLARFIGKTTLEDQPETTPDFGELAGTCDCAASMSGNGPPHHPTCPSYVPSETRHLVPSGRSWVLRDPGESYRPGGVNEPVDLADRLAGRA